MEHAKRLENSGPVAEIEIVVLREKAFEHELVRSRAAQADIRVLIADDLVVRAIVHGGEARVAERRERIGGDRGGVALADDDNGGHAELLGEPAPESAQENQTVIILGGAVCSAEGHCFTLRESTRALRSVSESAREYWSACLNQN